MIKTFTTEQEALGAIAIIERVARKHGVKSYTFNQSGNQIDFKSGITDEIYALAEADPQWSLNTFSGGRDQAIELLQNATAENITEVIAGILQAMINASGKETIQNILKEL